MSHTQVTGDFRSFSHDYIKNYLEISDAVKDLFLISLNMELVSIFTIWTNFDFEYLIFQSFKHPYFFNLSII